MKDTWSSAIRQYAFSFPYLMYELLAISAFHLSVCRPERSQFYRDESTKLQTEALRLFNDSTAEINPNNLIPAFLFSGFLSLHFFCATFSTPSPDLENFLDQLVQSIRLLRGVRAVLGKSWETVINSDIKDMLQIPENPVGRKDQVTHEFENLRLKITHHSPTTLTPSQTAVCSEAINQLTWAYNCMLSEDISELEGNLNSRMVTAWPVTLSAEYTELLNERRPEALIVLAYFAVLLHWRRKFWAVGNAGRFLLAAINAYLGEPWESWLVWPREVIFYSD